MHRLFLIAGGPLLVALSAACASEYRSTETVPTPIVVGSGRFVSESRPVQAVTRVVATGGLRARVAHTGVESLEITAEDNILPLVETVARAGTLTLGWRSGTRSISAHGIDIRIGVRELRAVEASGGAQIDVDGIAGHDFSVTLSGAAQFIGSGAVARLSVDLSGASRARSADLTAHAVTARLSGASTALLRIVDSLAANISGASVLEFLGDPRVEASVSDTSIVRRVGP
jgi:hypothetical protein